ncbi:hypothetical protein BURPS1710b_2420 [Burkholderia pseudomallei 1710b]|uniref:Uncharacterized protein n=1 Tax=Burkholderia pseudomallei (strain 1710b) TaxID=320372 RepID=Q3JRI8_BURP1|nr:hypothetical protein BURPS1710b_2420 [Burkholderia pseudomallei 1710b]
MSALGAARAFLRARRQFASSPVRQFASSPVRQFADQPINRSTDQPISGQRAVAPPRYPTTSTPFIVSCPEPQKMSHRNWTVPGPPACAARRTTAPGGTSARTPYCGIEKPITVSCAVSSNTTDSCGASAIRSGVNTKRRACTLITRGAAARTRDASTPASAASAAPLAAKSQRRRGQDGALARARPRSARGSKKKWRIVVSSGARLRLGRGDGHLGQRGRARRVADAHFAPAEPAIRRGGVPRHRQALVLRAGRGQRKHQRARRVVRDVARHRVVLLMDVSVEHGDVRIGHQHVDDLRAVARGPVPLRREIEERPVREDDDARVLRLSREIPREPFDLRVADAAGRIRHVVDDDEMHALVIECVMGVAEDLAVRGACIEARVVLARHQVQRLRPQLRDDRLKLPHPCAALGRIVGRVRQIAREHHEVGRDGQCVDGLDRLRQRAARVGVDRGAGEAPVRVGELDEEEIRAGVRGEAPAGQRGSERDAAAAGGKAQEIAPFQGLDGIRHGGSFASGGACNTAVAARIFPVYFLSPGVDRGNKLDRRAVRMPERMRAVIGGVRRTQAAGGRPRIAGRRRGSIRPGGRRTWRGRRARQRSDGRRGRRRGGARRAFSRARAAASGRRIQPRALAVRQFERRGRRRAGGVHARVALSRFVPRRQRAAVAADDRAPYLVQRMAAAGERARSGRRRARRGRFDGRLASGGGGPARASFAQ